MSPSYKLLPQYTYEEYTQWEGRWELIDDTLCDDANARSQTSMGGGKYTFSIQGRFKKE